MVSYPLFARILGPYLNSTKGIGSISNDKNASSEDAQGIVMFLYTDHTSLVGTPCML